MSNVIRNFELPKSYWWRDPAYIVQSIAEKYAKSVDHMWVVEWEDAEVRHILQLYPMFHRSAMLRITDNFVMNVDPAWTDDIIARHMRKFFPS
jgi:hypothetical protein